METKRLFGRVVYIRIYLISLHAWNFFEDNHMWLFCFRLCQRLWTVFRSWWFIINNISIDMIIESM